MAHPDTPSPQTPPDADLFRAFARIGLLSFGGPAAQIAVMHKELVEDRAWLTEQQFLNALSFCMLLPGPEAMQLATYCGWRLRGTWGGLLAGTLFVLPGALVMAVLAAVYAWLGAVPLAQALFLGIKATVVLVVLQALFRVSQKALKSTDRWVLAGLSFVAIFALGLPFPLIIALAACYGWLTSTEAPERAPALPQSTGTARTLALWGALWAAPLVALWAAGQTLLLQLGLFFSKLAIVTFGGAYAVLAYMTQEVVQTRDWITTAQMMDGLGLAETTPGPLILVTQFVGFLAGFSEAGWAYGLAAAVLTLWVTFVPCFLWIFAGAPYIEWISGQPRLAGALAAITAAVVGVILNLSLWFATHVFFAQVGQATIGPFTLLSPVLSSLDLRAAGLALVAALALFRLRWGIFRTLALTAALGAGFGLIG